MRQPACEPFYAVRLPLAKSNIFSRPYPQANPYRRVYRAFAELVIGELTYAGLMAFNEPDYALFATFLPPACAQACSPSSARPTLSHGCIYFIIDESGRVKIGHTRSDPNRRRDALQTGHPDVLRVLGSIPGSRGGETALHQRFHSHRLRADGEWFAPGVLPSVLDILMKGHI